jgi:gamma-glutamylcyclotransferase (GGCT)/AIG2-like uncharacterized protein YtfP
MKPGLYAFYGSLRRGMENYDLHKENSHYLYSARLTGYKLYSRGQYPFAVRTGGPDAIVVEVYQITDSATAGSIHQLEVEEGYFSTEEIIGGKPTTIYLFNSGENYPEVPGGDWVTFFRQRGN